MEKLNRYHDGPLINSEDPQILLKRMVEVFELQRSQIEQLTVRQANQVEACRVAVHLVEEKAGSFRSVRDDFESKWTVIELRHPALIAGAVDSIERLKITAVRPELGLKVGRTLWDLYNQWSDAEMIMYARKSQHDHEMLGSKIIAHLDACQRTLSNVDELVSRPYESLETLEQCARDLNKLTQVTLPFLERKLIQGGDEASGEVLKQLREAADSYDQLVKEAETFINNYTLSLQCVRLQKVTTLAQSVWELQEQMKGVLGIAVTHLTQRFHVLLIMHEFPSMQDLLVEEALKRAHFRQSVSASMRALESALEPSLVDEMNRRAGFLSDRHPFMREFFVGQFPWLRDELLHINIPIVPGFDRALPTTALALFAETAESLVNCSHKGEQDSVGPDVAPVPASPSPSASLPVLPVIASPVPLPPKDKDDEADMDASDAPSGAEVEEYRARIVYLEQQLARRMERSASQMDSLRKVQVARAAALEQENQLLQSELSVMGQTLSLRMAESSIEDDHVAARDAKGRRFAVLSDFAAGDRVVFFKSPDSGFYEAVQSSHVYLSRANCDAFASMKLGPVFVGLVISDPEHEVATKKNFFKLAIGTSFTELTVELDVE